MSAGGAGGAGLGEELRSRFRERAMGRGALTLNMTPLIDVVFLILVYFMMISTLSLEERSLEVRLPAGAEQAAEADPLALPERPVVVEVRSLGPGAYALRVERGGLDGRYSFAQLGDALLAARASGMSPTTKFLVQSDDATLWEHTVRTLDAIRGAGFSSISFSGGGS